VYNLNKITDRAEDSINRPEIVSHSTYYYLIPSVFALFLSFFLCTLVGVEAVMVILTTFIIAFVYSIKISEKIPRLKEIVGVKSLMVALSWGLTGSILPACSQSVSGLKIILAFGYIFIHLLVNTILCDVRDIDGDEVSGVTTLPIALGLRNTRLLLLGVNSLLVPWLLLCKIMGVFTTHLPALLFGVIYGYILILVFSRKGFEKIFIDLAVDGEWIPIFLYLKILTFF
jgi:4-hydroxybenzoate polyprenyltransferase